MGVSSWFLVVFVFSWLVSPVTQLLFLVAPKLHHRLGLTEADALKPEFKWFLLDEKAIAVADMTYLVSGAVFVSLAIMGERLALLFGLYTCACYVFVSLLAMTRWILLAKHGLSPLPASQRPLYFSYMVFFLLFGLYGLYYLWGLA